MTELGDMYGLDDVATSVVPSFMKLVVFHMLFVILFFVSKIDFISFLVHFLEKVKWQEKFFRDFAP